LLSSLFVFIARSLAISSSGEDALHPLLLLEHPINLFFVIGDLMIISCPILHCGHSTLPSFGELVPKIMYFFFFAE